MAFSKAPSQDTYQTKPLKLIWALQNRGYSGIPQALATNGYFDLLQDRSTKEDDYHFVKRDGVFPYGLSLANPNIRGMYYWEDEDKLYVCYDDKIDIIDGDSAVLLSTQTPWSTTTGDVGFTEFYYDDGTTKVVASDGVNLCTFDSANVPVLCTDPDLPTPHKPHIVFLDGYLFLIKDGTSDIYNSELNDPLSWVPGDFLTAEMLPDTLSRISRLNNYLVALGTASVEYFFDAGNASGSPLQRNDTPVKQLGFLGGFATHSNKIYFVGQAQNTAPTIYVLEDFKVEVIDNPALRRVLQPHGNFYATIISMGGHDFYCFTADTVSYVMELESRTWAQWKFQDTETFPINHSVSIPIFGIGHVSVFAMTGESGVFYFNPGVYEDVSVPFPVSVLTYKTDFDTMRSKYMSKLTVSGDRTVGNLTISYTDDDYQTYSTGRNVSLAQERPSLFRLGRFVERAFLLSYTHNAPLRLHHLELSYNIGAQ